MIHKLQYRKVNAVRREGAGRETGLPLKRGWGGKKGYLPLIHPLASEVGFCLSKYCRCDTRLCERVCYVGGACYGIQFAFPSIGDVRSFCCTINAFEKCPSTPQENREQHDVISLCSKQLHNSARCFFSATLSIYLVSEEYPSSMIHIYLGLPIV